MDEKIESTTITKSRHSINPATGEPGPEVPVSIREDVDRAVKAAQFAFNTWSEVRWAERDNRVALRLQDGNVRANTHFELDPRMPLVVIRRVV